jgi:hypothetical protein
MWQTGGIPVQISGLKSYHVLSKQNLHKDTSSNVRCVVPLRKE